MNRNPVSQSFDGESLQTDVMRFMAIIAFCLIAILSLVRDVNPPVEAMTAQTATAVPAVPEKTPEEPIKPTVTIVVKEPPELVEEPVQKLAVAPRAIFQPATKQQTPLRTSHTPPTDTLVQTLVASVETPVAPVETPVAPVKTPVASVQKPVLKIQPTVKPIHVETLPSVEKPASEGLTLRFVSDGDFLRLIAKGDVQVYAFREREFLALGQNYEFYTAPAPKQVYEVLPETIPNLIDQALAKRKPSTETFKWGISLPRNVERQIEEYLGTVSAGQLLIDRYGEVHYVASR